MRFTIPQFIEHEPKIIGPLTFKQFLFIGVPGAICFILYYSVPFSVFILACLVLGGIGFAFAFLKLDNIPLPVLFLNSLKYFLSPKMYLWRKQGMKDTDFEKEIVVKKEKTAEDELPLKINGGSRLKSIKTKIETQTKQ